MALEEAFDHLADADTDNLGPLVDIDPGVEESESNLADGSHGEDTEPGLEVVLVLAALLELLGDNCLVVVGAEWMVAWRYRTVVGPEAVDQEPAVEDSCFVGDVGQLPPEEMCMLGEVRDQGLLELPLHNLWKWLVALKRAKRWQEGRSSSDWAKRFDQVLDLIDWCKLVRRSSGLKERLPKLVDLGRSSLEDHEEQVGLMDSWKDIVVAEDSLVDHRPVHILTVAVHKHSEDLGFHNRGKHVASVVLQQAVVDTVRAVHTFAVVMLENWAALVGSFLVVAHLVVPVEVLR